MLRTSTPFVLLGTVALLTGCSDADSQRISPSFPAPSASASTPAPPPPFTIPELTPSPPPTPAPTTTPTVTPTPAPTPAPTARPVTPPERLPPLLAEPVRTAANTGPVLGGTLLVSADGTTAIAADPDRDSVFLVDLATRSVRTVATAPNDQPWRSVEGAGRELYVVARRAGALLVIDRDTASITARIPVCNAPRGLAYTASSGQIHVACQSGRLVSLNAQTHEITRQLKLSDDLRDVIALGDRLLVTRFRESEVLLLDADGSVLHRQKPIATTGGEVAVAFRAAAHPSGSVLLAHQLESTSPVGTGAGSYYGGGCFGGGVVQQALSTLAPDGSVLPPATTADGQPLPVANGNGEVVITEQRALTGLVGPTDLALSRDGRRVAVIATGNAWPLAQEMPTMYVAALTDASGRPPEAFSQPPCGGSASQSRYVSGEPVAVAFDAAGRWIVQSREPAMLELEGDVFIPFSAESRFDSGLALFHANSGTGISCASCHPEGGDDGHVWSFLNLGLRRTQSLEGGVSRRTPFHWDGDLATFDALIDEVMLKRMSLAVVPPQAHLDALAAFLDRIPAAAPFDDLDPAAIARGRTLFEDATVGCATCHAGPDYSDENPYDVGTGRSLITPSLRGVAVRAPFLHDGCAATLLDRFGACGGTAHGDLRGVNDAGKLDLVTFMQSL